MDRLWRRALVVSVTTPPVIKFDEPSHTYTVNGKPVPSVTTILNVVDKPALVWWGMKVGVEGVCQLRNHGEELPWDDPEGVVDLLKRHRLTTYYVKRRAADRGTSLHNALEAYLKHGTVPNVANFPVADRGYVQALASALLRLDLRAIESEQVVASLEHGYAGRFDHLLLADDPELGLTRIDLKTGKNVYPDTQFPQLEAYEHAAVEMGKQASENRAVLLLREDGQWGPPDKPESLARSCATFKDFLGIKAAFDAVQRIKAAVKAEKKAAK